MLTWTWRGGGEAKKVALYILLSFLLKITQSPGKLKQHELVSRLVQPCCLCFHTVTTIFSFPPPLCLVFDWLQAEKEVLMQCNMFSRENEVSAILVRPYLYNIEAYRKITA